MATTLPETPVSSAAKPTESTPANSHPKSTPDSGSGSNKTNKRKREALTGIQPVKLAPNPFNMTARNFPKRKHLTKTSSGFLVRKNKSNQATPSQALERVRAALQPSLNVEIEKVLQSYQEMYRMAAYNVGDNLKETVTEDDITNVLRNSLEEAKKIFKLETDPIPEVERAWTPARNVIITKNKMQLRREREEKTVPQVVDNFDYPIWSEDRLTDIVEMIMGVKASKILGFASAKGRIYNRHPKLFRYLGDQEDKNWLYENGHFPLTGGKSYLMLADDIRLLAISHPDYKDNLGIKAEDVKGFIIPEFILKKVKLSMKKQALIQKVRKSIDSPS